MSAEMVSSTNAVEIYVPLLNEGTNVLRPTKGIRIGHDAVLVLETADYDPTVEEWEFPPGSRVQCVSESRGGRTLMVARHRVEGREHE
jgi:hypothetical protein